MSRRFGWTPKPWTVANASENVRVHIDRLETPLRWAKPRRIFVCSMGDLFHEQLDMEDIAAIFSTMRRAHWHTFQVLTKRPARMLEYFRWPHAERLVPNIWLGVTAEDQRRADERIPLLLQTPAAVRFVSCEPLLGAIDLGQSVGCGPHCDAVGHIDHQFWTPKLSRGVDWVIVGCESGPKARPCALEWARIIRNQCLSAGVPFFLKQLMVGGRLVHLPELDGRGWQEFPEVQSW